MVVAVGQFTIYDLNDIERGPTEPSNPSEDMVWLDTSGEEPYQLYIYKGGRWRRTDYESLEELDPEQYTIIKDSQQAIRDLDNDGVLTRYERSVIRGEIANIIGDYLNGDEKMPTITQIDAGQVGDLYALRQESRDLGLPTNNATYVRVGTAYTALRTYLSSLTIKAWDINTEGSTTVDSEMWDSVWEEYYIAYNYLRVTNNERAKQYADDKAAAAEKAAKGYADDMKTDIDKSIGNVEESIDGLGEYIDGAFRDGVIDSSEVGAIRTYINTLNSEKANMDNRYNTIYGDTDLTGSYKTNLLSAKNAYNTAHTNLINTISSVISDGKVTEAERTSVDTRFTAYRTALGALSTRLDEAINSIAQVKADRALADAERFAESEASKAKNDAIAAVNNSDQFEEVAITNPITIEAPVSTLALPSFEGRHHDSWTGVGANILRNGDFSLGTEHWLNLPNRQTDGDIVYVSQGYSWGIRFGRTPVKVVPGETYTFSALVRQSTGSTSGARLRFSVGDAVGSAGTFQLYANVNSTEWTRYSIVTTIPKEIEYINGYILNADNNGDEQLHIAQIKIELGANENTIYTSALEDVWAANGNRIQPIYSPTFSSITDLTINAGFYGDGTHNDEFSWDIRGNAIKISRWKDIYLSDLEGWRFSVAYDGYKRLRLEDGDLGERDKNAIPSAVKYDGIFLSYGTSGEGIDIIDSTSWEGSAHDTLIVTISNEDSGWGARYNPSPDEVSAYFNGWRMCNGTYNTPYNGSGNKVWYPIGDTNLNRSTMSEDVEGSVYDPVPEDLSPSVNDGLINPYQLVYKLEEPIQEFVNYIGILELVQGDNEILITYPDNSPEITKGTYKYATNLATLTETVRQLVPTLQRRLALAEEVITDDSIVHTVMSSREYEISLQGKADTEALGDLASKGELDDLAGELEGQIGEAIGAIDFSPFVTKSDLDQTTDAITAKFLATGGMNLIHNSIGFAGTDFWEDVYPTGIGKVATTSSNELDTLGFGSGFLFTPTGGNKGIYQDIDVIPGQIYTLSWYLKKITSGSTDSHRFWIQIQEDGVTTQQIANNRATVTDGFEARHMNYVPNSTRIRLRFIGYSSVEAILTGLMLTIGDIPLQWSLATGELYNTNIRMDMKGLRVSQFNKDMREIGYTSMSPEEFAGYYDTEGNGVFEKVFHLNEDETVTKKLRAREEITMGSIKIVNINSSTNKGWAFVPIVEE